MELINHRTINFLLTCITSRPTLRHLTFVRTNSHPILHKSSSDNFNLVLAILTPSSIMRVTSKLNCPSLSIIPIVILIIIIIQILSKNLKWLLPTNPSVFYAESNKLSKLDERVPLNGNDHHRRCGLKEYHK
jgi:hypothetical protein